MFSTEAFATPVGGQSKQGGVMLTHLLTRADSSAKVPNFNEQHPSLAEMLEVVKDWWN